VSVARQQVLVFRELPPDQLALLQAAHAVTVANPRVPSQLAAFEAALGSADGLIGSSFAIDAAVLARAPRLRVISSISVGVDNYDLAALRAHGVMLCHTPGVLTETTADTVFAMIMAASRRIVELSNLVRDGRWRRNIGEELFGWDVHGKTLGLLGFGRIGQAVARRAALGFGMPVLYHSRHPVEVPALTGLAVHAPLDELLADADIVTAVLPLTSETRGLMGAREFGRMKPGAIFVNAARGAIVDEAALLHALEHGTLRAAALDVFATEPLPLESPLRRHPKVTCLPHVGPPPMKPGMPWRPSPPATCCRRWRANNPKRCTRTRVERTVAGTPHALAKFGRSCGRSQNFHSAVPTLGNRKEPPCACLPPPSQAKPRSAPPFLRRSCAAWLSVARSGARSSPPRPPTRSRQSRLSRLLARRAWTAAISTSGCASPASGSGASSRSSTGGGCRPFSLAHWSGAPPTRTSEWKPDPRCPLSPSRPRPRRCGWPRTHGTHATRTG
jgi:phosphogluconate 2-dehydrogenase